MATNPTPASCLRQAEAITGDPSEWPLIRELIASLTELTKLTAAKEQR